MQPNEAQENMAPDEGLMIKTRLEELLEQRGRTLYWLAKQVGTTYNTMHKLARGRADSVKFEILSGICRVLECTPGDVLVYLEDVKDKRKPAASASKSARPSRSVKASATVAGA